MVETESAFPQCPSSVLAALLDSAQGRPELVAFQDRTGAVRSSWGDVAAAIKG
jgi:hypothetical protein